MCAKNVNTYSYVPAAAVLKLSVLTSTFFILVSTLNEGAMCSDFVSITAFLNASMYSSSPAWKIAPENNGKKKNEQTIESFTLLFCREQKSRRRNIYNICVVDLRKGFHPWCYNRDHYEMDKLKILKEWGNFVIKFDV